MHSLNVMLVVHGWCAARLRFLADEATEVMPYARRFRARYVHSASQSWPEPSACVSLWRTGRETLRSARTRCAECFLVQSSRRETVARHEPTPGIDSGQTTRRAKREPSLSSLSSSLRRTAPNEEEPPFERATGPPCQGNLCQAFTREGAYEPLLKSTRTIQR